MVNASASITGRYPNVGPQLLLEAGILVVDEAGQDVREKVADGAVVRLDHDTLYLGDTVVAKGTPLTAESMQVAMTEARAMVTVHELGERANHMDYVTAVHPVRRDARLVRFEITSRRSGR